ncbi:hypothetical protein ES702_01374 [subsurface metagenome]
MKEITGVSGACADQARIAIRFDLKGRFKQEVENLMGEGFSLSIDREGFISGEAKGTFEEICRIKKLLETRGFEE